MALGEGATEVGAVEEEGHCVKEAVYNRESFRLPPRGESIASSERGGE